MTEITNIQLNKFELKRSDVGDPVAQKVSWNPARPGGANFRTHKLKVSGTRASVERSVGMLLFGGVFMLGGLIPAAMAYAAFSEGTRGLALFLLAFGGVFIAVGAVSLSGRNLLTFDKSRGVYFRGSRYLAEGRPNRERQGRLSEIHALQLTSEMVSGGKHGPYTSYELNVVFKDGERINVMDHGDGRAIEASAKQLGGFLDVPIWQAVY